MISEHRKEYCNNYGEEIEKKFIEACIAIGYECIKSSHEDNMYKHIDFYIKRPDRSETSVDVKGGNHPETIWVEFRNVNGGDGWLYGEAELIALYMENQKEFLMLKRDVLKQRSESIVEKIQVASKYEAYKKLYTRKGRKDVISKLHLPDIQDIIIFILKTT